MINFMQSNQNISFDELNIIDKDVWDTLYNLIKTKTSLQTIISQFNNVSIKYNIDKKNVIKDFLNFIIRNKVSEEDNLINNTEFYSFIENILHFEDCNDNHYVNYSLLRISSLMKEL
jgi:hypothetical protein